MKTPVWDFVAGYEAAGAARFHMPGHKGRGPLGCEGRDITEISGADSLYEAGGIIADSERAAAGLFGASRTFFSAGGSSQCVGAMLLLALQSAQSRRVLAARNAHKSFVQAAALLDISVRWLWPEQNERLLACPVDPAALDAALAAEPAQGEKPAAVYLTSPDYLGNIQPVAALAKVCHAHGVPLLVDNAHGAYLHFLPRPCHPLDEGADACCDSAHKTLPVLTGGAYLHLAENGLLQPDGGAVRAALGMFGSSSPSYLILQSLDACNRQLAGPFRAELAACLDRLEGCKAALTAAGWRLAQGEPMKLTVRAAQSGWRGERLAAALRRLGVECEYADPDDLVLMPSPANTGEDFDRLLAAFGRLAPGAPLEQKPPALPRPRQALTIRQAALAPAEELSVTAAAGRVCAAPAVACPPAVPAAVSGEKIGPAAVAVMEYYGMKTVRVVK